MAHKKSGGSSSNGRDTIGKRLGIKKFGGQAVIPLKRDSRGGGGWAVLAAKRTR